MKYFIIIDKDEITESMLGSVDSTPVEIYDSSDNLTNFRILSTKNPNKDCFRNYKKYNALEVKEKISLLEKGIFVKNKLVDITYTSAFADPQGKRARLGGTHFIEATAGTTQYEDFIVPENRLATGAIYKGHNTNFGDRATFQVVDVDFSFAGQLYPSTPYEAGIEVPDTVPWSAVVPNGVLLDEFAKDLYVSDSEINLDLYKARLYAGLCIRVIYTNTGDKDSKFYVNLKLHKED